jgi:hypothetical protein
MGFPLAFIPRASATWYLDFGSGTGQALAPGVYLNASRYAFNGSTPGLDFSGNGHGDNTLLGNFTVLAVTYAPDGTILSFAAEFTQHDEGNLAAWSQGLIEYNYSVPEGASTALLLGLAVAECMWFRACRPGRSIRR